LSDRLLEAARVTKSFSGVRALRSVTFDLRAGEVHALVGENGAGKSTFIKILTGAETPDSGSLSIGGDTFHHLEPSSARALGIAAIYQHPVLFPGLTVAENIALPLDRGHAFARIDWKGRRRMAEQLLNRIGAPIDPQRDVDALTMPERQLVEIARAIGANARILIMDEPTASLTEREVANLLEIVRGLRATGVGIIYISHKFDEIFAVADRVTVLRDGESIDTRRCNELNGAELVRLMVGCELSLVYPKRTVLIGDVALELRDVSNARSGVGPISLSVRRGEILGIAGLVGAGRTELAETIFGIAPATGGEIIVNGKATRIRTPADAMRLGLAYVPEDRQRHGIVGQMSIAANVSLSTLSRVSSCGLIDRRAEDVTADGFVSQLRIKTPSVATSVDRLSGGNQQKVALARWLAAKPAILVLDEPTQGVDIAAKAEIHQIMETLAASGVAIVLVSSELPELLAMADRIAVMRTGALVKVLDRTEASPHTVLALALGHAA
jgi:rhamnose transport system ATP-binding protein